MGCATPQFPPPELGELPDAPALLRDLVQNNVHGVAPDRDVLALGDDARAFVRQHVGRYSSRSRLQRLTEMFTDRGDLTISYDHQVTLDANDAFASRRGNCMTYTQLFVAMAREVGIHARFREARLAARWTRLSDNVLALNRHMTVWGVAFGDYYEADFGDTNTRDARADRVISDAEARAQFFNNLAAEAFARDETEEAVRLVNRALLLDPESADAWANLATMFLRMREMVEAEQAYHHSLRLDPSLETAVTGLSRLYSGVGRHALADTYEELARNTDQRNPYYHYALGEESLRGNDPATAVTHFRQAVRLKDSEADFYFELGRAYWQMGEQRKALSQFNRVDALTKDTDQFTIYANRLRAMRPVEQLDATGTRHAPGQTSLAPELE